MKITEGMLTNDIELNDFEDVFNVLVNEKDNCKVAITINPDISNTILMVCASRLNRIIAKHIDMSYEDFLEGLKRAYFFDCKYGNLNLTEEQLEKMINKDLNNLK